MSLGTPLLDDIRKFGLLRGVGCHGVIALELEFRRSIGWIYLEVAVQDALLVQVLYA